jgi:NAD(P)-dependent dehydrogenase (short-subunit alcohol dehydrogenase family)
MSDMSGRTVVVTGGNSGIGFETAAALGAMGARVIGTPAVVRRQCRH